MVPAQFNLLLLPLFHCRWSTSLIWLVIKKHWKKQPKLHFQQKTKLIFTETVLSGYRWQSSMVILFAVTCWISHSAVTCQMKITPINIFSPFELNSENTRCFILAVLFFQSSNYIDDQNSLWLFELVHFSPIVTVLSVVDLDFKSLQ